MKARLSPWCLPNKWDFYMGFHTGTRGGGEPREDLHKI